MHFPRLSIGRLSLGSQPVALGLTIEAAIERMTPQARAKNVNLRAVVDQFEDAIIGDPFWLQQWFANLLSNAIKFTPPGGRVELCCTKGENDVEVTVTDTGQALARSFCPASLIVLAGTN